MIDREHLEHVTPFIEELGRRDARTDAAAGNQDRYTHYLALYTDEALNVAQWQAYRTAYESEQAEMSAESA